MEPDVSNLQRFVQAQEATYLDALAEIRGGEKRGHWMWFIFPQLKGLGRSETSHRLGIQSLEEAREYLAHPILGPRLCECIAALHELIGKSAIDVFGEVDALKLRSSLTLFSRAEGGPLFEAALARWFSSPDQRTTELLDER